MTGQIFFTLFLSLSSSHKHISPPRRLPVLFLPMLASVYRWLPTRKTNQDNDAHHLQMKVTIKRGFINFFPSFSSLLLQVEHQKIKMCLSLYLYATGVSDAKNINCNNNLSGVPVTINDNFDSLSSFCSLEGLQRLFKFVSMSYELFNVQLSLRN